MSPQKKRLMLKSKYLRNNGCCDTDIEVSRDLSVAQISSEYSDKFIILKISKKSNADAEDDFFSEIFVAIQINSRVTPTFFILSHLVDVW